MASASPVMLAASAAKNTTDGTSRVKPSLRPRAVAHTASSAPDATSRIHDDMAISPRAVLSHSGYGAPRPEALSPGFPPPWHRLPRVGKLRRAPGDGGHHLGGESRHLGGADPAPEAPAAGRGFAGEWEPYESSHRQVRHSRTGARDVHHPHDRRRAGASRHGGRRGRG